MKVNKEKREGGGAKAKYNLRAAFRSSSENFLSGLRIFRLMRSEHSSVTLTNEGFAARPLPF